MFHSALLMAIQDKVAGGEATETGEKEEESAFMATNKGSKMCTNIVDSVFIRKLYGY